MDLRILIFFVYFAFDGALAGSDLFSYFKNLFQSSGLVTINTKPRSWPNGIIPYEISPYFSEYSRQMIMKAINHIHENSCVRFVKRTNEDVYTKIQPGYECSATVGYAEGSRVNLRRLCTTKIGAIQHELMHVMGFNHEQNRRDRDQYITVFEDNIEPDQLINFEKDENGDYNTFGLPYDYQSVMHYSSDIFARYSSAPTMVAKNNKYRKLGQNEKLSPIDIQKINAMYPCNGESPLLKKDESATENSHEISIDDNNNNVDDTYNVGDWLGKYFGLQVTSKPEVPHTNNHENENRYKPNRRWPYIQTNNYDDDNESSDKIVPYRGQLEYFYQTPSSSRRTVYSLDDINGWKTDSYNNPTSTYTHPYSYNPYFSTNPYLKRHNSRSDYGIGASFSLTF